MNLTKRFFLMSFALLVFAMSSAMVEAQPLIRGTFSAGGKRLFYFTNGSPILIHGTRIQYCDGTEGEAEYGMTYYLGNRGRMIYSTRSMQSVTFTVSDHSQSNPYDPVHYVTLRHSCEIDEEIPSLSCKNVEIASTIHRSMSEPIRFIGSRFIYRAGLLIPGVDGPIWVGPFAYQFKSGQANTQLGRTQTLTYDHTSRTWTSSFPSMNIPAGDYSDVWLLVIDEYDQQAKCKIGNLTIR